MCEGYTDLNPNDKTKNIEGELLIGGSLPSQEQEGPTEEQSAIYGRWKRQKSYHRKTRTGCATCKRRRVKCDEQRPKCSKCIRAGVKCEGYEVKSTTMSTGGDNANNTGHPTKSSATSSSTPSRPTSFLVISDGNYEVAIDDKTGHNLHSCVWQSNYLEHKEPAASDKEQLALEYWNARTENSHVCDARYGALNVLGIELPQAAWTYNCIRYSLLAASCVTTSLDKIDFSKEKTMQGSVRALQYANAAIQAVFEEKPPPHVAALIAFVFWYTEAWHGSWETALSHLMASVRICREALTSGLVSEGVAWYIEAIGDSVPIALRDRSMLDLSGKNDDQEAAAIRLSYCTNQVKRGIAWIDLTKGRIAACSDKDLSQVELSLTLHQEEMKWLLKRWEPIMESFASPPAGVGSFGFHRTPLYHKVIECVDDVLINGHKPDILILEVRLKVLIRTVTLFAAGSNLKLRECAAGIVSYGAQVRTALTSYDQALQPFSNVKGSASSTS